MKKQVKMDKITASAVQVLPGSPADAVRLAGVENPVAQVQSPQSRVPRRNSPTDAGLGTRGFGRATSDSDLAALLATAPVVRDLSLNGTPEFLPANNVRSALLVHLGEMISNEARMLRQTPGDNVLFVLTLDHQTEISLHLQWRAGQVEIEARCQRGDYPALNAEWSQLQETLAQQGVQLSQLAAPREMAPRDPLLDPGPFTSRGAPALANPDPGRGFSASGFGDPRDGGHARRDPSPAWDDPPLTGALTEPLKIPSRPARATALQACRLFESWA